MIPEEDRKTLFDRLTESGEVDYCGVCGRMTITGLGRTHCMTCKELLCVTCREDGHDCPR